MHTPSAQATTVWHRTAGSASRGMPTIDQVNLPALSDQPARQTRSLATECPALTIELPVSLGPTEADAFLSLFVSEGLTLEDDQFKEADVDAAAIGEALRAGCLWLSMPSQRLHRAVTPSRTCL